MAKRTPKENPSPDSEGFDVSPVAAEPVPPAPIVDEGEETDEPQEEFPAPQPQVLETPEQRRLMREKRIAKAEEEHLRRLTRQYAAVARLVAENRALKNQLEQRH